MRSRLISSFEKWKTLQEFISRSRQQYCKCFIQVLTVFWLEVFLKRETYCAEFNHQLTAQPVVNPGIENLRFKFSYASRDVIISMLHYAKRFTFVPGGASAHLQPVNPQPKMNTSAICYVVMLLFAFTFMGCSAIRETSKQQLETGVYKVFDQKSKTVYAVVEEEQIRLYPATRINRRWSADTSVASTILLAPNPTGRRQTTFSSGSFDLDVLTILFKYRPYTAGFPNQLNTNFNGTGYMGYRSDYYLVAYDNTPIGVYQRRISHFAYSIGVFAGLGATNMNPFVTNNQVPVEYDGVVNTKGMAGLIGVGNLTFGVALGFDHLMDKNHSTWIYQRKPWVGFSVGLNLN